MKKLIAMLLALVMVLSFAACADKNELAEETMEETVEEITEELPEEEIAEDFGGIFDEDFSLELPLLTDEGYILDPNTGDVIDSATGEVIRNDLEESTDAEAEAPAEATESLMALQNIWAAYGDDEKFAIMGGNPEAGVMDAPGSYDMAYAENLGFQLVIPAEQLTNVAEASTMIHMMNANTFSCGAVKLADGADAAAFAQAVRDALQGNQWICGFPETLVIADVGGVVIIAFGVNDAMTPFQANLAEAYADAQILFNEAIAG